jgi:hypothetical protein
MRANRLIPTTACCLAFTRKLDEGEDMEFLLRDASTAGGNLAAGRLHGGDAEMNSATRKIHSSNQLARPRKRAIREYAGKSCGIRNQL